MLASMAAASVISKEGPMRLSTAATSAILEDRASTAPTPTTAPVRETLDGLIYLNGFLFRWLFPLVHVFVSVRSF
ncbi:hypothetical protein BRADI_3g19473v3 [Brachypodium distachyon]|uniref:Uncharacterized protein n=1 Tax=Brachypodium distachyon TaxID=15368 RepID=A0A2K2CYA3_BRADI|nr:hypothetical protein BRADI_3g19473v3 [Brachypodium distachyon]